ncbi:MAG TPA: 5'/3'-nucleotidase SurE [Firmicutes bacterium]|nr:5'/3'-nucleotidase SurE [Bacillota bacterium]
MLILVTNDDGINAPGIWALARAMQELGRVMIVAPSEEKSGTGHSITVHRPLRVEQVRSCDGLEAYVVNGTPADCVKLGMEGLSNESPNIVVSGINRGPNLGTDVLYSGTVSGAMEGAILGAVAMAISVDLDHNPPEDFDYEPAARIAKQLVERFSREALPKETLLNVNVPAVPYEAIKGIKFTRLGTRRYRDVFDKRLDPRGRVYYWMAGDVVDLDPDPMTDTATVKEGYVSITPIHYDLTEYNLLEEMKHWHIDLD